MSVKVSVCIPVYGVEKYVERCARSLFEQTMKEGIEFVFVNDCTPDRSMEVLEQVLKEYPERKGQVKIIHHEVNQGVGSARQHGVSACSGEYIIHCDPDDWVDLDLYEKMCRKAEETDADMVYAPMVFAYEDGKKKLVAMTENSTVEMLFRRYFGTPAFNSLSNKIFKREWACAEWLEVPSSVCLVEDLLRVGQMLQRCRKIASVTDSRYYYFQNASSSVHTVKQKSYEDVKTVYSILQEKLSGENKKHAVRVLYGVYARALLYYGYFKEQQEYYKQEILQLRPEISLRTLLAYQPCSLSLKVVIGGGLMSYRVSAVLLRLAYKVFLWWKFTFAVPNK